MKPTTRRSEVVFADVAPVRLQWLWRHRIPRGMVTLLAGDGGVGKSTVMLDIAARVTTGRPMPDSLDAADPASVIWLGAEDAIASVLVPRLTLAGADLKRVRDMRVVDADGDEREPLIVDPDLEKLSAMVHERAVSLVVFDPLVAFVDERTNLHHNQDARRVMARLHALAERCGIAVVGIHHLNRAQHADAIHRLTGSAGIANASRSALIVARDPDSPTERRVLALAKHNLAPATTPSLAYRLVVRDGAEHPSVVWDGVCALSANELMAAPSDPQERSERDEAVRFLRELLAGGAVRAKDGEEQARAHEIAPRTLKRARARLGVQAYRLRNPGPWFWRLPSNEWPSDPVPPHISHNNNNNNEVDQEAKHEAKQGARVPEGHCSTAPASRPTASLIEAAPDPEGVRHVGQSVLVAADARRFAAQRGLPAADIADTTPSHERKEQRDGEEI